MANSRESISLNMKHNKCRDTNPELILRKELWRQGLRFRKNCSSLPGKPDIVFMSAKVAVFVDGKMWHGYNWEKQKDDFKSNREFWIPKIERNIQRDKEVNEELKRIGWKVLRFWDFEVTKELLACIEKIKQAIKPHSEVIL